MCAGEQLTISVIILVLNYTIFVAQELKNNLNEYPNLQNVFDEYFYDVFECNKIIDNIRQEKEDLAQQVCWPNLLIQKIQIN